MLRLDISKKNVDLWAQSLYAGTLLPWQAAHLLEALSHDSLPKPTLRWDDFGADSTNAQDLSECMDLALAACMARVGPVRCTCSGAESCGFCRAREG